MTAQLSVTSGPSWRGLCRVQAQRHQLLADAALAGDEHGAGQAGELGDLLAQLLHGRAIADEDVRRAGGVIAEAGIVGLQGTSGAEDVQGAGQAAGQHLAKTHLALAEQAVGLVDVQRAQRLGGHLLRRRQADTQRNTHGVAERHQAVAVQTLHPGRAKPHRPLFAQHALRQLPAQLRIDLRLRRQDKAELRLFLIQAQEAGHVGHRLLEHRRQGQMDEAVQRRLRQRRRHEVQQGSQFVGVQNGLVELAAGGRHDVRLLLRLEQFGQDGQLGRALAGRVEREAHAGVADGDDVVVLQQHRLLNADSVDARAVGRFAVAHVPAMAVAVDFGVPARGVRIVQDDGVLAVAAHQDGLLRYKVRHLRSGRASLDDQACVHASARVAGSGDNISRYLIETRSVQ